MLTSWLRPVVLVVFVVHGLSFNAIHCFAGATASQWVIVVNGGSERSRTIANYYSQWRNIPAVNIIVLDDVPAQNLIGIEIFREKILKPVLQEVELRRLGAHIQGIAYSSDFPNAVDLTAELTPDPTRPHYLTPIASINGLTYLYRLVLAKQIDQSLALFNNFYAQRPGEALLSFNASSEAEVELLKEAVKFKNDRDFIGVAKVFDKFFETHPHQFPAAYVAAENWAVAGESIKAMDRLQKAIEGGWSFAEHIRSNPQFQSLRGEKRFQALVRSSEEDSFLWTPALGFDARNFYSQNGVPSSDPKRGLSYMMSMVLAVCTDFGNTEAEALAQLKTSISADHSQPSGTFFITSTDDVRTTCRKPGFQLAIDQLKALGRNGEIIPDVMPMSRPDVLGVTMGTPFFGWASSQSTFVPGAIGDNLTSLGGEMDTGNQTKLTEFLRHGAAAASGAVTEPYSIQAKFPHPTIHASYATGLTCAEAFYLAVQGPYQLLIVGDPLCQPFVKPPKFELTGIVEGQSLRSLGRIGFKASKEAETLKPNVMTVLLNGVIRGRGSASGSVYLNDPRTPPGVHEFRFIASSDSRQSERWEKSVQIVNGTSDQQIVFDAPITWSRTNEQPLAVSASTKIPGVSISIRHDWEVVATLEPGQSSVQLPMEKLGHGPVRLQAVGKINNIEIYSMPIVVEITP